LNFVVEVEDILLQHLLLIVRDGLNGRRWVPFSEHVVLEGG